jgi:hypothetical protein
VLKRGEECLAKSDKSGQDEGRAWHSSLFFSGVQNLAASGDLPSTPTPFLDSHSVVAEGLSLPSISFLTACVMSLFTFCKLPFEIEGPGGE